MKNKTHPHKIKVCPECKKSRFIKDIKHNEIYCYRCGLIVSAPYSTEFITPELLTMYHKQYKIKILNTKVLKITVKYIVKI